MLIFQLLKESANDGPQAKSGLLPVFIKKRCWNTAMFIHEHVVHGCLQIQQQM